MLLYQYLSLAWQAEKNLAKTTWGDKFFKNTEKFTGEIWDNRVLPTMTRARFAHCGYKKNTHTRTKKNSGVSKTRNNTATYYKKKQETGSQDIVVVVVMDSTLRHLHCRSAKPFRRSLSRNSPCLSSVRRKASHPWHIPVPCRAQISPSFAFLLHRTVSSVMMMMILALVFPSPVRARAKNKAQIPTATTPAERKGEIRTGSRRRV